MVSKALKMWPLIPTPLWSSPQPLFPLQQVGPAKLASFLFPKHAKYIVASGPLHILFPFPQNAILCVICTLTFSPFIQVSARFYYIEAFQDDLI